MTLNIFEVINNSISDFVENQENKALKRGTGSYSIPFRGSIFGEIETEKVLSKLNAESVDVIWLGSNPNVPESLDAILSPSSPSHYEGFVQQAMNDNFSEAYKNSECANVPLWDPINKPNNKWQFYSEIFNKRFGEHKTLMANIVLWGRIKVLPPKGKHRILHSLNMQDIQLPDSHSIPYSKQSNDLIDCSKTNRFKHLVV